MATIPPGTPAGPGQQGAHPGAHPHPAPRHPRLDPLADRYAARTHGMKTSEIRALFSVVSRPEVVSLAGGMPAVTALPLDAVGSMIGDLVSGMGAQTLQYGSGQGDPRLRERICDVMALEGITDASPSEVVVTVGSQQGLDLVTRVFVDPGDVILAEAPSYVGALGVFQSAEARVRHVAMDDDGLIPEALEEALVACRAAGDRVKFLYTVPNFHNPAGVTLSEPRREAIMAIAERWDLLIIEDNPYGLLGFEQEPMRALRARDAQRVIYLGSFSKTFSPGLRVGWVLAPLAVREKLVLATEAQVLCPPSLTQYAVARYLDTQPWREQIKLFTELYRERRDACLESLEAMMPAGTTWTHPHGGFYVWLKLPAGLDAKLMQPRAVGALVAYVPGIGFYADGSGQEYMRLSYCYPEPDQIREGVRRLARVIEAELDLHSTFDKVDTGTFRAVRAGSGHDAESMVGPANSDRYEDGRA
ncbi:aminotransferase-like domain-containing protein [Blastococcus sp. SYSU DS0539]